MELISMASSATWMVGVQPPGQVPLLPPRDARPLTYAGADASRARGVVESVLLEDGTTQQVLSMRAGAVPFAVIYAAFPIEPQEVDTVFRASIGFAGTGRSDGATFEVWVELADGTSTCVLRSAEVRDGSLRAVEVDLGPLVARGPCRLWLGVAGGRDAGDKAVWGAPRLARDARGVSSRATVAVTHVRAAEGPNDEGGSAEPYLYARVVVLDGFGVNLSALGTAQFRILDARNDGRNTTPSPLSASLHGNLPEISNTSSHVIPPEVGDFSLELRPITGIRSKDSIAPFAATRSVLRVALMLVLMEEDDTPSSSAVRTLATKADRDLANELNSELRGALLDVMTVPAPGQPPASFERSFAPLLDGLHGRLVGHCEQRVRRAIRDKASWPLNPDDHRGTFVQVLTFDDLLLAGANGRVVVPLLRDGYSLTVRFAFGPA